MKWGYVQTNKGERKRITWKYVHITYSIVFLEFLYWHLWNPLQNLNIYSAGGTISARFLFYFSAGELSYYFVFFSHFRFAFAFDSANIKQINIKLNFLGCTTTRSYSFQLALAGSSCWSCQIAIIPLHICRPKAQHTLSMLCGALCIHRVRAA